MNLQDDSSDVLSAESLTLNTNSGKYETTVSAQGLRLVSFVARFTVSGDASGNFNGTYTAVDTNFLEYRSQDSQRYFFNSLTQSWNFEGYGSSLDLNTSDAFNSSDSADSGIQFIPELPTVQEEISSTAQVSIQKWTPPITSTASSSKATTRTEVRTSVWMGPSGMAYRWMEWVQTHPSTLY